MSIIHTCHCERSEAIQSSRYSYKRAGLLRPATFAAALAMTVFMAACTPKVQVEAPDKPIEINLNVNIEHHVKVEIERDVQKAIANNQDIF